MEAKKIHATKAAVKSDTFSAWPVDYGTLPIKLVRLQLANRDSAKDEVRILDARKSKAVAHRGNGQVRVAPAIRGKLGSVPNRRTGVLRDIVRVRLPPLP